MRLFLLASVSSMNIRLMNVANVLYHACRQSSQGFERFCQKHGAKLANVKLLFINGWASFSVENDDGYFSPSPRCSRPK